MVRARRSSNEHPRTVDGGGPCNLSSPAKEGEIEHPLGPAYHEDYERGRYVVQTRYGGRPWEVIVEPVPEEGVVVVVTAYPSEAEG